MFEVAIKRIVACFSAAVISFASFATVERTASVYHSYEFTTVADTPAPSGFTPFYIAHYGRHGSRRLTGTFAADVLRELKKAEKAGRLTDEGKALLADVRKIADAHAGSAAVAALAAVPANALGVGGIENLETGERKVLEC